MSPGPFLLPASVYHSFYLSAKGWAEDSVCPAVPSSGALSRPPGRWMLASDGSTASGFFLCRLLPRKETPAAPSWSCLSVCENAACQ